MSDTREQAVEQIANFIEAWRTNETTHEWRHRIARKIYEVGYRLVPELPVLTVGSHSCSIWCPHCGEEFGIESNIETAYQAQCDADLKAINNEDK